MGIKSNRKTILFLIVAVVLTKMFLFSNNETTVVINNQTDQTLENLMFLSNAGEKDRIFTLAPHSKVSFQYDLGGFNENAASFHQIDPSGRRRSYSIIGYIDRLYTEIHIEITSIDQNGELKFDVEVF